MSLCTVKVLEISMNLKKENYMSNISPKGKIVRVHCH